VGVLTLAAPLPISEGRSSGLDDVDPLHSASSIDDDEEAADAAEEDDDDEDRAAEAPNLLGAMIGGFGWFSLFSELAVRLLDGGLRTAKGLLVDSDNFGLANIDPPVVRR